MKKKIMRRFAVAAGFLLILAGAGCSHVKSGYDEVKLYYQDGAGDNKKFQQCVPQGTGGPWTADDKTISIPTTLRTWAIQKDGGDSKQPIDSGTKPGPDNQPGPHVLSYVTVEFYINTNCGTGDQLEKDPNSPLVQFWQTLGVRGWGPKNQPIANDDGLNPAAWTALLQNTIVSVEQKVLARGTRFYLADDLDANSHGEREDLERPLAPSFQDELRAKLGGDYFCGVRYKRNTSVTWTEYVADGVDANGAPKVREEQKEGYCPPVQISITDIDFADPTIAAARAKVYAAEQEAKAKLIAAQAELDQSRKLGQAARDPNYLRYKEIEAQIAAAEACKANPNCTVIVDGSGGAGVNVNAGSTK